MTLNDIQRAQLAIFAVREAGPNAALEQMKAIAMCVRNRVRQHMHDGNWLKVIDHADEISAHPAGPRTFLDPDNRSFQVMIRDIDDIYFSSRDYAKSPSLQQMVSLDEAIGKCCYWMFLDRPLRPWFKENIISSREHQQRGTMGTMLFFE